MSFLNEDNKKIYFNLTEDEKEKVKVAINESNGYFSEADVLNVMRKAIITEKSFELQLVENIPSDLKPIFEKLDEKTKNSLVSSARLYPNIDTHAKMESYWKTRGLEGYLITESKKVLNENLFLDNSTLSEDALDRYLTTLKNL
jgi:hypothetical protein